MLHASLIELAEQAPLCTDQATLRGVLTESHDLTRNALAHDTNAVEVAHWFSRLLTDALHSPAATELTDGRIQIVTGPFGRGEGMPTSPVEWLSILPKSVPYQYNQNLEKVLTETGFVLAPLPATLLPTTREDWEHRIDHALEHGDGEALGVYTDAGTWMAEKVLASRMAPPALLRNAVEHRPPAVQTQAGLPRKDVPIDIRRDLLSPLARLARWAAIAAGSSATETLDRIAAGVHGGVVTQQEADYLSAAWRAGIALRLERWAEHLDGNGTTLEQLTQVQRALFGACCRDVSLVMQSIAAHHRV